MRTWFRMAATGGVGEVLIYDEIGKAWWNDDAVSAKDFDEALKALGDVSVINLRINSPGGDVFDGVAIYNMLANHAARVVGYVDGIAASVASLVLMAADEIVMPDNAFLLLHEPSSGLWGTAEDMLAMAADLDRMTATFAGTYSARAKREPTEMQALMKEDRLMTATEAKEHGLCDRIIEPVRMAASYQTDRLPPAARDAIKAVMTAADPQAAAAAPEPAADPEPVTPAAGSAAPAPAATASNVVNIAAARPAASGSDADYAVEVIDMCRLAGKPEMARGFIAGRKPIGDVRAALLDACADADDKTIVRGQSRMPAPAASAAGTVTPAAAKAGWSRAIAAINARGR